MREIEDTEREVVEGSAGEVPPLVICGAVEVEDVDVSGAHAESVGPGDRAGAIEAVSCEVEEGSTFTVGPDADSGAC